MFAVCRRRQMGAFAKKESDQQSEGYQLRYSSRRQAAPPAGAVTLEQTVETLRQRGMTRYDAQIIAEQRLKLEPPPTAVPALTAAKPAPAPGGGRTRTQRRLGASRAATATATTRRRGSASDTAVPVLPPPPPPPPRRGRTAALATPAATPPVSPPCHVKVTLRMKRSPAGDDVSESASSHFSDDSATSAEIQYEVLRLEGVGELPLPAWHKKKKKRRRHGRPRAAALALEPSSPPAKRLRLKFGGVSRTIDLTG